MTINEVLSDVQQKLNAPKSQYNNFGKYSYRNCEDILEAVKPLLTPYKAAVTVSDEIVQIGGRYYIKATAMLKYGTEKEECSAFAREPDQQKGMNEAQVTGASSSYARKYALNGLFAIDDNKDPDSSNNNSGKKADEPLKCSKCGKVIKGARKGDKSLTAQEVAKQCGGMCIGCYKSAVAEGSK